MPEVLALVENEASKTSRPCTEPTWDSFLPPGCWTISRTALEEKCLKRPAGELWFLSYTLVGHCHLVSWRVWLR